MNAIELLRTQHEEAKGLFKKIEKAEDDEKLDLFEQLADALAVHATIEEKQFYPATKNARTEELLQEAVEEHLAAKRLIADLLEMSVDDPQFDAKVAVLKEEELEDLGVVMEDMAEDLKAAGAPRESVPAETGSAAPLE